MFMTVKIRVSWSFSVVTIFFLLTLEPILGLYFATL